MGGFMKDSHVATVLDDMNHRFGPDDGVKEMAGLQKTFGVFSRKHSLKDSFGLLNIGPVENWPQRKGFYKYLDSLKTLPSDKDGQSAHDRLIDVLSTHLASPNPLPVHFTAHSTDEKPGLHVRKSHTPHPYSTQEYFTISFPTTAVEKNRDKRRPGGSGA
jgi:hypothetical protein